MLRFVEMNKKKNVALCLFHEARLDWQWCDPLDYKGLPEERPLCFIKLITYQEGWTVSSKHIPFPVCFAMFSSIRRWMTHLIITCSLQRVCTKIRILCLYWLVIKLLCYLHKETAFDSNCKDGQEWQFLCGMTLEIIFDWRGPLKVMPILIPHNKIVCFYNLRPWFCGCSNTKSETNCPFVCFEACHLFPKPIWRDNF